MLVIITGTKDRVKQNFYWCCLAHGVEHCVKSRAFCTRNKKEHIDAPHTQVYTLGRIDVCMSGATKIASKEQSFDQLQLLPRGYSVPYTPSHVKTSKSGTLYVTEWMKRADIHLKMTKRRSRGSSRGEKVDERKSARTSDQEKPRVFVQPSKTEKVFRDVSPTVSPTTTRRRCGDVTGIWGPELPIVTLDATLVDLPAALYEKLGLLLRKDGAWRRLLQTEGKVTRKMEIDVSSYLEDFENKPGKKALDILSEKGWTVQRLHDSLDQLGYMDCIDLLERIIGAEETSYINNGLSVESLNIGQGSASSLSIGRQQSIDSEGLGTETDSFPSDQMFGGGDGERSEFRSPTTYTSSVQLVRPVSGPFDVDRDQEETFSEPSLPKLDMLMEDLMEEEVDCSQDQARLNHTEIQQESREQFFHAEMCKLLLPKSSIPVTQASFRKNLSGRLLVEDTQWKNLSGRLLVEDTQWKNLSGRLLVEDTQWKNLSGRLLVEDTQWKNLSGRLLVEDTHWKNLSGRLLVEDTQWKNLSERLLVEDTQWKTLSGRLLVEDTQWKNLSGRLLVEDTQWKNLSGRLLVEDTQWKNLSGRLLVEGTQWKNLSGRLLVEDS
ncbi:hypothetical protein CHS0354_031478 [Potamilus streckersoni]|uniref:Uncharacterized protein n=1 Tax=Potamilus streckersoni TaxID=2493646 RepID=A0AAE0SIB2_9BIVA|nr:hypothetical protein CHS0354_031478 [Potamilus streckersoni]